MTIPSFDGFGDGWVKDSSDPRLAVLWPGSEDYEEIDNTDDNLEFVFLVARYQCQAFAPVLLIGEPIPENWVAAQVLQARALVRSGVSGSNDTSGTFDQTVTVFPMDWTVKNLIRPKKAKPYFGGKRVTS